MTISDNEHDQQATVRLAGYQERHMRTTALIQSLHYLANEAEGIKLTSYAHLLRYVAEEIYDTLPELGQDKHNNKQGETHDTGAS